MPMTAVLLKIDVERIVPALRSAREKLDSAEGELVLDFSGVRRIETGALQELEQLAAAAEIKSVKLALRGVSVDVYKVLKLVKLAQRFSFLT